MASDRYCEQLLYRSGTILGTEKQTGSWANFFVTWARWRLVDGKHSVENNFSQRGQKLFAIAHFLWKPLFTTAIQDSLLQNITKELFNVIKNEIKSLWSIPFGGWKYMINKVVLLCRGESAGLRGRRRPLLILPFQSQEDICSSFGVFGPPYRITLYISSAISHSFQTLDR
jgi:hypothetical protein